MITDLLDRKFVIERLKELESGLADFDDRRGEGDLPDEANELEPGDIQHALQEVQAAVAREETESSGQSTHQPSAGVGIDTTAFLSRDPVVSIVQSALDRTAKERDGIPIETAPPDDRRGGAGNEAVSDRRLGGAFEETDVRWAACIVAMGLRRLKGRHAFNQTPADDVPIASNARLVVVGDWATGLPRARAVAAQMRAVLDDGIAKDLDQHVIHLGDVYYAGFEDEYEDRLLAPWPVKPEDAHTIGSWTLNGNHDMYSGGHGYFKTGLADPRFARQQGSSFFSLSHPDWNILGLDTAYAEHDLVEPQADFARDKEADGKKLLLLSHHQLFSDSGEQGPKLEARLHDVLERGVKAWFWGHEHRCVLYKPHEQVEFARCIGHGGVPVYQHHTDADPLIDPAAYEFRGSLPGDVVAPWARFGFAVLDFDGPKIAVRYIDEEGNEHHNEVIE
jgi:hypothetical protein